jgi:hypothetical protein
MKTPLVIEVAETTNEYTAKYTNNLINYTYLVRTLTCVWYGSVFKPCKPIHTINLYTLTNIYTLHLGPWRSRGLLNTINLLCRIWYQSFARNRLPLPLVVVALKTIEADRC